MPKPAKPGTGRHVPKGELPHKVCLACGRPFAWRKKWARHWAEVRYCSDRCRRRGSGAGIWDLAEE